jgi:hypothetical protein
MKAVTKALLGIVLSVLVSTPTSAQERPAKRVADIVGVALLEYKRGVDSLGRISLQQEFDEAVSFLATARENAERLSGTGADSARLALDSLAANRAGSKRWNAHAPDAPASTARAVASHQGIGSRATYSWTNEAPMRPMRPVPSIEPRRPGIVAREPMTSGITNDRPTPTATISH